MAEQQQQPVIVILDQNIGSSDLKDAMRHQTKLHMDWCAEVEKFYSLNAQIIPLEYCVRKVFQTPLESMDDHNSKSARGLFIYNSGYDLGDAVGDMGNFGNKFITLGVCGIGEKATKVLEAAPKKRKIDPSHEIDSLEAIPLSLRNDRDHMMTYVQKNGLYLHFAHPSLLFDKDLILEAIKNHSDAFAYIPTALRVDTEFVKKALELNGGVFAYLRTEWRAKKDLLDISLKTSGKGFMKASDELRANQSFATRAVSHHWQAIKHVVGCNDECYSNLIDIIIRSNVPDEELEGSNLIFDKQTVLNLLDISHKAFIMSIAEIVLDKQIIYKALDKDITVVNYFNKDHFIIISKDHSLVKQIIDDTRIDVLKFASLIIKDSPLENVRSLIVRYPHLCHYAPFRMSIDPFILRYFDIREQCNKLNDVLLAIEMNEIKIEYLENLGYLVSDSIDILEKLKNRFSITHPGLIIPFHRFGQFMVAEEYHRIFDTFKQVFNAVENIRQSSRPKVANFYSHVLKWIQMAQNVTLSRTGRNQNFDFFLYNNNEEYHR